MKSHNSNPKDEPSEKPAADLKSQAEKLYTSKNQAAPETNTASRLRSALFSTCRATYTVWKDEPFSRISHIKSCEEAKEHMRMLRHDPNVCLTLTRPDRFFPEYRQRGAIFHSKELTPREAESIIETFESKFGS